MRIAIIGGFFFFCRVRCGCGWAAGGACTGLVRFLGLVLIFATRAFLAQPLVAGSLGTRCADRHGCLLAIDERSAAVPSASLACERPRQLAGKTLAKLTGVVPKKRGGVRVPATQPLRPSPARRMGPGGAGGVGEPCDVTSLSLSSIAS